ncbi:MAG: type III-A CRISPR-associated RAMP protein Csm5 [Lachnospiraceae bacterium]|nr:type III-A CRISPR-associated RAMP protein Csm5 [Lachnospiraceae bacterium]
MRDYQQTYRVTLNTVGPVFIGSGREITKKEYLFLDRKETIGMIQVERFYAYLRKQGKSGRFEHFLLKDRRADLWAWIHAEGIAPREVIPFLKYRIPVGELSIAGGRAKWQIMECMKDPYGMPYVPGSSLKGMLRTVLLAARILERGYDDTKKSGILRAAGQSRNRNLYLKREAAQVEKDFFNVLDRNHRRIEDAVNDEMSGFVVSDSEPLRTGDLVLCQKVEVHTDGSEKTLNLLRECIRPDTKISFTITVDSTICSIQKETIERAIIVFARMYQEMFADAFQVGFLLNDDMIFLGGGNGFVSKTITYPMYGKNQGIGLTQEIFEKTKVPWNHKHNQDQSLGASPHILKCTRMNGKLYQMGLCRVQIE